MSLLQLQSSLRQKLFFAAALVTFSLLGAFSITEQLVVTGTTILTGLGIRPNQPWELLPEEQYIMLYAIELLLTGILLFWPLAFVRNNRAAALASLIIWIPLIGCLLQPDSYRDTGAIVIVTDLCWFLIVGMFVLRKKLVHENFVTGLILGACTCVAMLIYIASMNYGLMFLIFFTSLLYPLISIIWLIRSFGLFGGSRIP